MNNASISTKNIAETVASNLSHVFNFADWVRLTAIKMLCIQTTLALWVSGFLYFNQSSTLLYASMIISLLFLLPAYIIYSNASNALDLKENLDTIKKSISESKESLPFLNKNMTNDNAFSIRNLFIYATFLERISQIKDISIEAKDGVFSMIRAFSPINVILFSATYLILAIQIIISLIVLFIAL